MAQEMSGGDVVNLQEMVLAQMFEGEALLNVLERKGGIRKVEVLEEVKRLREKAAKAH
jgi:hypothetical protein